MLNRNVGTQRFPNKNTCKMELARVQYRSKRKLAINLGTTTTLSFMWDETTGRYEHQDLDKLQTIFAVL